MKSPDNKIPYTTINGTHDDRNVDNPTGTETDGINWWTNGFWGGMMWLMHHETGNEKYKEIAKSRKTVGPMLRRILRAAS